MASRWRRFSALALLGLAACEGGLGGLGSPTQRFVSSQTPAVRASNGGSAELELSACAASGANAEAMLRGLLNTLETAGLLVTADGGSSKLSINLCPQ